MNLAILRGIGQAALEDNRRRREEQRYQEEQSDQQKHTFLGYLDRIANSDQWPDESRASAAHGYASIAMNPKAGERDFKQAWESVWRPRPAPMQPAERSTKQLQSVAPYMEPVMNSVAPGTGDMFASNMDMQASRIPMGSARPTISGPLTRQELFDRTDDEDRRKYDRDIQRFADQQRFAKPQRSTVEGPDGVYTFENGQSVGFTPFHVPTPVRLTEQDKDREEAYKLYSELHKVPIEEVKSSSILKADAERTYADRTGRSPKPSNTTVQMFSGSINPGTAEYQVAEDLASGKLTFSGFRTIYAYSRDPKLKAAIYSTARQINPDFNPADFELGYGFAKNPRVRQQVGSQDNALSLIDEMTATSDKAKRLGPTMFNKLVNTAGVALGGRTYTDLNVMHQIFADEISGALGFGTATDMTRKLGIKMSDLNLSSANFRSAMGKVQIALQKKRRSLVNQMGRYGTDIDAFSSGSTVPSPTKLPTGPKVGQKMRTRSGQTIIIKALSADGKTVTDYDVVP